MCRKAHYRYGCGHYSAEPSLIDFCTSRCTGVWLDPRPTRTTRLCPACENVAAAELARQDGERARHSRPPPTPRLAYSRPVTGRPRATSPPRHSRADDARRDRSARRRTSSTDGRLLRESSGERQYTSTWDPRHGEWTSTSHRRRRSRDHDRYPSSRRNH